MLGDVAIAALNNLHFPRANLFSRKKRNPKKRKPGVALKSANKRFTPAPPPRSDRHQLIALLLASLLLGLLVVINCDRVTHRTAEMGVGGSRHGWPWIFLKRELVEEPVIYFSNRTYSWPFPAVKGEIREWSYENLALDCLVVAIATLAAYWAISNLVLRYDRWKYNVPG